MAECMCIYGLCVVSKECCALSEYMDNIDDSDINCISLNRLFKNKIKYAVGSWPVIEDGDILYIIAVPKGKPRVRIIFNDRLFGPQFVYPHGFAMNDIVLFSVSRKTGISAGEILEVGIGDVNVFNDILLKVQQPYAKYKRVVLYSDELEGYSDENIIVEKGEKKGFYIITNRKP